MMQTGLYVALSARMALEKRMETIANNVANAGTAGFRADEVSFQTLLSQAGERPVAFTSPGESYIARRNGEISKTGNPLDVAVSGDAWLGLETPAGTVYTRDGRMRLRESGVLESLNGYRVLDAGGAPITLDPSAGAPQISRDGMISQGNQQVGALGLFSIDPRAKLSRYENSGVIPDRPAAAVIEFTNNGVVQGYVEGSNVNPVLELTKMMMVQRTFESLSAMTDSSETSLQDAIKTLGGTST
jgi:flagellar basal-body rod protein FlgF